MEKNIKYIENIFFDAHAMYADAIFRYCYFKVGDREVAKDITQDVFIKIWEYLAKGEDIENMKAYLYKVAHNAVIDFWRKSKSIPDSNLSPLVFENAEASEKTELQAEYSVFLSMLKKISEEDRDLIVMRYVEDMTPGEIAQILGVRENTVSVRISRAVSRLRDIADGNK